MLSNQPSWKHDWDQLNPIRAQAQFYCIEGQLFKRKTGCKGFRSDDVVCGVARTRHVSLGFLAWLRQLFKSTPKSTPTKGAEAMIVPGIADCKLSFSYSRVGTLLLWILHFINGLLQIFQRCQNYPKSSKKLLGPLGGPTWCPMSVPQGPEWEKSCPTHAKETDRFPVTKYLAN